MRTRWSTYAILLPLAAALFWSGLALAGKPPSEPVENPAYVYRDQSRGKVNLYISNSDGTQRQQVARGLNKPSPVWAPDGNTIYFSQVVEGLDGIFRQDLLSLAQHGGFISGYCCTLVELGVDLPVELSHRPSTSQGFGLVKPASILVLHRQKADIR